MNYDIQFDLDSHSFTLIKYALMSARKILTEFIIVLNSQKH